MPAPTDSMERVRQFVSEHTRSPLDRVLPETRLNKDLGVDGDAWDLLDAFHREFDVDMAGLRFDDHFGSERTPFGIDFLGLVVAVAVFGVWQWKWWVAASILLAVALYLIQRPPNPYALRVRHLARAAATGRWEGVGEGAALSETDPSERAS